MSQKRFGNTQACPGGLINLVSCPDYNRVCNMKNQLSRKGSMKIATCALY